MSALKDWAKLDTEWYDDPDLIAAAEKCEAAFVMWPVLIAKAKAMSHASRNPDGAVLIAPARLAFDVRCDVSQVSDALAALSEIGKVRVAAEGDHKLTITLNGFAKWQAPRGSNRDKQQRKNAAKALISSESDTTETPPDTTLTPSRPLDVDVDRDRDVDRDGDIRDSSPSVPKDDTPRRLFEHWLTATSRNPNQNRLTKKRRGMVRARLADGYTEDQLRTAIDGIAGSAWHAGGNPDGTRYDTFQFIFRDGENVEKGIERAVSAANRAAAGTQVQAFSTNPRHAVSEEYDDGIQWHDNTQPAA